MHSRARASAPANSQTTTAPPLSQRAAVRQARQSGSIAISRPGDSHEREADRVAAQVCDGREGGAVESIHPVEGPRIQGSFLEDVWEGVSSTASAAWEGVSSAASAVGEAVSSAASAVWEGTKSVASTVWEGTKSVASSVWSGVKSVASSAWSGLKTLVGWTWEGVKAVSRWGWNVLKSAGEWVWDLVTEAPTRVWRLLEHIGSGIVGTVTWLWDGIKGALGHVWDAAKGIAGWLGEGVTGLFSWIWRGLRGGARWAWKLLKGDFSGFWEGIGGFFTWLGEGFVGLASWGWEGLTAAAKWAWEGIKGVGKWLWQGILSGAAWVGRLITKLLDLVGFPEIMDLLWQIFKFNTRPMTALEIAEARKVFGGSIDYSQVRIDEHSLIAWIGALGKKSSGMGVTLFHTINFNRKISPAPGNGDMAWLIHELVHVSQYEHVGSQYIGEAVHAQATAGYGYMLGKPHLRDYNREQQGDIVKHYYLALSSGGSTAPYATYIAELQAGDL